MLKFHQKIVPKTTIIHAYHDFVFVDKLSGRNQLRRSSPKSQVPVRLNVDTFFGEFRPDDIPDSGRFLSSAVVGKDPHVKRQFARFSIGMAKVRVFSTGEGEYPEAAVVFGCATFEGVESNSRDIEAFTRVAGHGEASRREGVVPHLDDRLVLEVFLALVFFKGVIATLGWFAFRRYLHLHFVVQHGDCHSLPHVQIGHHPNSRHKFAFAVEHSLQTHPVFLEVVEYEFLVVLLVYELVQDAKHAVELEAKRQVNLSVEYGFEAVHQRDAPPARTALDRRGLAESRGVRLDVLLSVVPERRAAGGILVLAYFPLPG